MYVLKLRGEKLKIRVRPAAAVGDKEHGIIFCSRQNCIVIIVAFTTSWKDYLVNPASNQFVIFNFIIIITLESRFTHLSRVKSFSFQLNYFPENLWLDRLMKKDMNCETGRICPLCDS